MDVEQVARMAAYWVDNLVADLVALWAVLKDSGKDSMPVVLRAAKWVETLVAGWAASWAGSLVESSVSERVAKKDEVKAVN